MAENHFDESGSSAEETGTDDELSDPAPRRESAAKDSVSKKKDKTACEDNEGFTLWQGLCLLARIVLESAIGSTVVCAIGPEERNRCRNRIVMENTRSTTIVDSGPDHQNGTHKGHKICNIL